MAVSVSTEFGVTSAPVPEVVGSAMHGLPGRHASLASVTGSGSSPSPAIAFPTSRALPPPAATTTSHWSCRSAARPRSTVSSDGSASTSAKMLTPTPAASSNVRSSSSAPEASSDRRPQTISARLPIAAASAPSRARTPEPKKISRALRNAIPDMQSLPEAATRRGRVSPGRAPARSRWPPRSRP